AFQERVPDIRHADERVVVAVHQPDDQHADDRRAAGDDEEILLRALAPLCAVRQQVYAGYAHWGSNLRMARPQATISDGASTIRRFHCTRREAPLCATRLRTL